MGEMEVGLEVESAGLEYCKLVGRVLMVKEE